MNQALVIPQDVMRRHAANALKHAHPYMPRDAIKCFVEYPHRCAPDAVEYARITGLPLGVAHGIWWQQEGRNAA